MLAWINWSLTGHLLDFCMEDFPGGSSGEEPACQSRRHKRPGFDPSVGKILWTRSWQPTQSFLPGESPGQRSLEGSSHRVTKSWTWLSYLACMYGCMWINFSSISLLIYMFLPLIKIYSFRMILLGFFNMNCLLLFFESINYLCLNT